MLTGNPVRDAIVEVPARREALRVESNLGEAHNNLAVVCMLTGRYSEAEPELQAAEKAGFRVNPEFKHELSAKLGR